MTGMLGRVLAEIRTAPPGTGLDEVARRVGLPRDEVDLAVDYWVRRGELVVGELGCAAVSCAGCPLRAPHRGGCGLIAISPRRPRPVATESLPTPTAPHSRPCP